MGRAAGFLGVLTPAAHVPNCMMVVIGVLDCIPQASVQEAMILPLSLLVPLRWTQRSKFPHESTVTPRPWPLLLIVTGEPVIWTVRPAAEKLPSLTWPVMSQ